jgi:4-hydroxy-3-methylbut-2-enyl diphosphate reductase
LDFRLRIVDRTDSTIAARQRMHVLLAAPRGFCAGVRRAIQAVEDALDAHGAPIFVRRAIVHNSAVVRALEAKGAIFVRELDEVPAGSRVIFSAHGVSPTVAEDAARRGLKAYDAVCPLVSKVHREVERHQRDGRKIIVIGHRGHPEIEGTLGRLTPGTAFLVDRVESVRQLPLAAHIPVAYAIQTTYSIDDAAAIVTALQARFTDLKAPPSSDICYATTNRQGAIRSIAGMADAVIVVGEDFSSNARRLAEVAAEGCPLVQLVASSDDLDWNLLPNGGRVAITAAASTPESSVIDIVDTLRGRFDLTVEEVESASEDVVFKRMAMA